MHTTLCMSASKMKDIYYAFQVQQRLPNRPLDERFGKEIAKKSKIDQKFVGSVTLHCQPSTGR
jgi:hypothetical protein